MLLIAKAYGAVIAALFVLGLFGAAATFPRDPATALGIAAVTILVTGLSGVALSILEEVREIRKALVAAAPSHSGEQG